LKIPVSLNYLDKLPLLNFHLNLYFTPLKMKIPVSLNYLDKLPLLNFHLNLYFTPLKMKIPVSLNYSEKRKQRPPIKGKPDFLKQEKKSKFLKSSIFT